MYLYLGNDAVIDSRGIVGIFDLDNASWSIHTRRFLSGAEKSGRLSNAAEDIPKSFVVTADDTVILTQPNTAVLARRLHDQEKKNV
jgi:hypothetical protein